MLLTQSDGGDVQQNKQVSLEELFDTVVFDEACSLLHLHGSPQMPPEV